jgi:pimeloyl-ACP methyl ester carboxylesterase
MRLRTSMLLVAVLLTAVPLVEGADWSPTLKTVSIRDGITLHYVEAGRGDTVIFVHGSISDYAYWEGPFEALSKRYHVIAYSRRYNYPNTNISHVGYSAITDADDLAALIRALHLGQVYVIGHSYGALTTLFLLVNHPGVARAAVLAEPPAVSLLNHLVSDRAAAGSAMYSDISTRMVQPMRRAFAAKDSEEGVKIFVDYVRDKPGAWTSVNAATRAETLRDAHEWEVMMTVGELSPTIDPAAIAKIKVSVLLLSGHNSYPFLNLTDEQLNRLISKSERIVLNGAGHQMFYDRPEICDAESLSFFERN